MSEVQLVPTPSASAATMPPEARSLASHKLSQDRRVIDVARLFLPSTSGMRKGGTYIILQLQTSVHKRRTQSSHIQPLPHGTTLKLATSRP